MNKYIDKELLWERLKRSLTSCIVTNTAFNTIKAVIDDMPSMAIEALSAEAVQGWIPVSERLPEELEYVLVTDGIEVWEDQIEKVIMTGTYRWGQCMSPVYEYEEWHWQPLPEPYKGGDDNG